MLCKFHFNVTGIQKTFVPFPVLYQNINHHIMNNFMVWNSSIIEINWGSMILYIAKRQYSKKKVLPFIRSASIHKTLDYKETITYVILIIQYISAFQLNIDQNTSIISQTFLFLNTWHYNPDDTIFNLLFWPTITTERYMLLKLDRCSVLVPFSHKKNTSSVPQLKLHK